MTSAAMIPHPPSHPVTGPNARVAQVNVVPQSGSARFSSWYATAMRYIGTNASRMIAGALTPARMAPPPATTNPRLAARLYAGAVEAVPTTTLETSPSAPPLSPLPVSGNPRGAASVVDADTEPRSGAGPGRRRSGRIDLADSSRRGTYGADLARLVPFRTRKP